MFQNIIFCANYLDIRKQDRQSFCDFIKLREYLNSLEENDKGEIFLIYCSKMYFLRDMR